MNWEWFIDRAKEPSTWLGVIGMVTATGLVTLTPEQHDSALALLKQLGILLGYAYGLIQVFWKRDTQSQPK